MTFPGAGKWSTSLALLPRSTNWENGGNEPGGYPCSWKPPYLYTLSASQFNTQCGLLYECFGLGKPKRMNLIAVASEPLRQAFATLKKQVPHDPAIGKEEGFQPLEDLTLNTEHRMGFLRAKDALETKPMLRKGALSAFIPHTTRVFLLLAHFLPHWKGFLYFCSFSSP